MRNIEVKILNPTEVYNAEDMAVFAARITQHGNAINTMHEALELYNEPHSVKTFEKLISLPHPTLQKFGTINVLIVGASRRFLAQITRHQVEVKFMSGSLQYTDFSKTKCVVPYAVIDTPYEKEYIEATEKEMANYAALTEKITHDDASYLGPQGIRNILIVSATPYEWIHIISQRTCRRNSDEMRYVMLRVWEQFYKLNSLWFGTKHVGPDCMHEHCKEQNMSCGASMNVFDNPSEIIKVDFPKLWRDNNVDIT